MELRTTENKINELVAVYEEIRRSSVLPPEEKARLPPLPTFTTTGTEAAKNASATAAATNNNNNNIKFKFNDEQESLIRSLRTTETSLTELRPRVDKFRKRLFEIDPVTEKPRYGPKSQARVRLLVTKNDFLSCQYLVSYSEQQKQQLLESQQYQQEQLKLQEQRQEQRRQEYLKKQQQQQQQQEQQESSTSEEETTAMAMAIEETTVTADTNINPDGSIIIENKSDNDNDNNAALTLTPESNASSPASLIFGDLKMQYDLQQELKQLQEASMEDTRQKEEEATRRQLAEEDALQKAMETQRAAKQAAEEKARTHQLHQQAEEARLRRRAQEEAQKEAERNWLNGIQKGPEGVKHYLEIVLQQQQQQQPQEGNSNDITTTTIDPSRIQALRSLCTIFEQIQKNPEEVLKRKIKRSNPNFHQDIGRHEGGIELLIAAGFRPTMLPAVDATGTTDATVNNNNNNNTADETNANNHDNIENNIDDNEEKEEQPDIAFLISKEPNLEHDMDGWMAWFDLNKATLEILQTELHKVDSSKRSRK